MNNLYRSLVEKENKIILYLGEKTKRFGDMCTIDLYISYELFGKLSNEEFFYLCNHLLEKQLIKGLKPQGGKAMLTLTPTGLEYYDELITKGVMTNRAFMAMKFGDDELDEILEKTFKPCVQQAGFELVRLDDNPKAGLIDNRMRVEIRNADFLIADLSHDNLGAYWEAGFAEGLGKPVIYTCKEEKFKGSQTHFDTNHHQTILWNKEKPKEAGEELKNTIRATLPDRARMMDENG